MWKYRRRLRYSALKYRRNLSYELDEWKGRNELIMDEKIFAYWLCNVPGVGNRTIGKLLERFGSTENIYGAPETELADLLKPAQLEEMKQLKANWRLQEEYEKLFEKDIQFILREDALYPARLSNIPDAPYGIFLKGHLPVEDKMSVAIIGARDCSEYGKYVAEALGRYMGANGVQVISGMARGIDGISQGAALEAGGTSYAVLGNGVDICYPARNRALYEQIQERGGILSAYPPGTAPRPQNFPPRNRIVSGLADVVVVIEARQKSGTLITVDMALEQGKEVYVVPGRITDRLSDGCNRLLKQGAGIFLSPEEFLEEIRELWQRQIGGISKGRTNKVSEDNSEASKAKVIEKWEEERAESNGTMQHKSIRNNLPAELQTVYDILDFYPQSLEQLLTRLPQSYTIVSLNTALMRLCLENLARQVSPGHFCRKRSEA